jgi:hypothetical protein
MCALRSPYVKARRRDCTHCTIDLLDSAHDRTQCRNALVRESVMTPDDEVGELLVHVI